MLSARDLTLRRGPEPLFERADFTIHRGEKVGLTGANGAGKSSLFAAIRGLLSPDHGDIELPAQLKIAHVEQEVEGSARAALEFVLDGDTELRSVQSAIADAERRDAALEVADSYAALESIDGYRARARAAAIMHGLGFQTADLERPVSHFSGGWRVRLAMARALGSRAELLLLDEPTNHLDMDAIVWLEEWLQSYPGTLLMISHDREFLDAVIGRVLHIENHAIKAYTGNYSAFEFKRTEELAQQRVMHVRQERRVAEITSFITRFGAKATKSRQAQSRMKMLERMQRIVPAHIDSPFEFEFGKPAKLPRPLLTLENAACGYGDKRIIEGVTLSIGPLDRIALVGPNGAGKSTLTKLLAGESVPLAGKQTAAADLSVGYFAQQQMEQLVPENDAFWHLRHLGGAEFATGEEQKVRDHLGRFGFQGDRAFDKVARFSGGEKARLTLSLLVARRPNLLLLDEPTNHLDIDMRHALTVALQGFEGGLVVVSHDRHLIKTVADTLLLVVDGKVAAFDGDLNDYQVWLKTRNKTHAAAGDSLRVARDAVGANAAGASQAVAKNARPSNNSLTRLKRELEQIERAIATLNAERAALETAMAGAAAAGDMYRRFARVLAETASLEERWLEVGAALETAEAARSANG